MGYNQNFPKMTKPKTKSPAKKTTKVKKQSTSVRRLNAKNPFGKNYPNLRLGNAVRGCRTCGNPVLRLKAKTAFGLPNIMNSARQNMRKRARPRTAFNLRYPNIGLYK